MEPKFSKNLLIPLDVLNKVVAFIAKHPWELADPILKLIEKEVRSIPDPEDQPLVASPIEAETRG